MLTLGDSIVSDIEKNIISRQWKKVKVKYYLAEIIECMYGYIKPLLNKCPTNIIWHIGTKKTVNETSMKVLDKF